MGSFPPAYLTVGFIWAYIVFGFLWLWTKGLSLNLITLGEEAAMQLGVETGALQRQIFIASSLMIGAMVSVSGMIGFVGLMIPHVMRLIVGSDHRLLLPASFLAGGIFLCWADTLARIMLAPAELPVGIITAFFGGPLSFSSLPRRRQKTGFMNPAIRTNNLTFAYKDKPVLDGVSLSVERARWSASSVPTAQAKQPC